MDLIPGAVLIFGAVGTVALLGWDTFQNRKQITKAQMLQTRRARSVTPQQKRRGLFNRG